MVAANGQLSQIRKLQRDLQAAGWDPRGIALVIADRFTGVSRFASLRYGRGWSSQRAVDEIKRHYLEAAPGERDPGLDVTRLNEWEHWPGSGVRPGLRYLEASSLSYRVPVSELGLTNDWKDYHRFSMNAASVPAVGYDGDSAPWWGERLRRGAIPELLAYFEVLEHGQPQPRWLVRIDGRAQPMDRRQFSHLLGALGGGALAGVADPDDHERLSLALATPERADQHVVTYLERALAQHRQADDVVGPRQLLHPVAAQLAMIERLLTGASTSTRRPLLSVAAQYAQFHGFQWLDAGNPTKATSWYDRALGWSTAANDLPLAGYVLERKADLAAVLGEGDEAVTFAHQAQAHSWRLTPLVAAWATRTEARAHAVAGDLAAANRKLDEAQERMLAVDDRSEEPSWIYHFNAPMMEAARGLSLTRLQPAAAIAGFERALESFPSSRFRDRGIMLAHLADAHVTANQPAQAATTAQQAATIATHTGSSRTLTQTRTLHTHLATRWPNEPSVRGLGDLLATLN